MEYKIEELVYGGKYHNAFWDVNNNANANIGNCLANCTTAVIGMCIVEGNPKPVSRIVSAGNWHNYLINGWKCKPFKANEVKVGDIIQWVDKCHVAKVASIKDGIIYVNASFYTGEHGVSVWDGSYDTRRSFSSLKEVSDFMSTRYPSRFFHCWGLDKESSAVGGAPEHILSVPDDVMPVQRNTSVNQIETLDSTLRIRLEPNLNAPIVGHVSLGYYNVLDRKSATDEDKTVVEGLKEWYAIAPDRWCANITTIYLPSSNDDIIKKFEELTKEMGVLLADKENENKKLTDKISRILGICEE